MSNTPQNTSQGVTATTILQIAFICLKLAKVITWTWPIVFLPYEITGGILILILIFALMYVLIGK